MTLDPKARRDQFELMNKQHPPVWNLEEGGGTAALHIYGAIGGYWGEIDAATIVPAIRALDVAELEVYINSPGGDVWDGIAIRNAIRQHPAHVTTHVDGIAASAASFIAVAGDDVIMGDNAQLMIHDAWTIMLGNADDMREAADTLDLISQNIADMYARKAGGDTADWRALMKAETWYSDREAVDAGLADRVDSDELTPAAAAAFSLSMFNYAGREAAPSPAAMATNRKETLMTEPTLAAAVGIPGEPVAAEYAAGPQAAITPPPAARTENRPVTLNSLMPQLLDAARRENIADFTATINNALTNVVLADDAGEAFTPPDKIGEVWTAHREGRPVIDSIGVRPLTSTKIEGWRWVEPTPAPAPYAGGLVEVPTGAWETEPVSETPSRWAHGNRIDRIYKDLGSADLISSLFAILDRNYQGVSEKAVLTDLLSAATPLPGLGAPLIDTITSAFIEIKRVGGVPTKMLVGEQAFQDFAALTVADLPAWIANATGFVNLPDGSASLANVFDVDLSFDLAPQAFLAYDKRAATVFESPNIHLEALVVPNGGIDIGWFAYGGTLINDARAVVTATVTAPAP